MISWRLNFRLWRNLKSTESHSQNTKAARVTLTPWLCAKMPNTKYDVTHLLSQPSCTFPRSSKEEQSKKKKKLQTRSLISWMDNADP